MEYKTLEIRGAKVMNGGFRHFAKGKYGYSFCIDLSEGDDVTFGGKKVKDPNELIQLMEEDKWIVQYTRPTSEIYEPTPFLQVRINFENKFNPPYIVVDGVPYDEKMTAQLQEARFSHVDVAVNPARPTERRDGSFKRTAYLGSLHVSLAADDGEYMPERFADPFA